MERVLIIEDDELIAELECDYLEANGYETDLAFDGITGEQKAKTEKYDAILLDVMLPGKTGLNLVMVCTRWSRRKRSAWEAGNMSW